MLHYGCERHWIANQQSDRSRSAINAFVNVAMAIAYLFR